MYTEDYLAASSSKQFKFTCFHFSNCSSVSVACSNLCETVQADQIQGQSWNKTTIMV